MAVWFAVTLYGTSALGASPMPSTADVLSAEVRAFQAICADMGSHCMIPTAAEVRALKCNVTAVRRVSCRYLWRAFPGMSPWLTRYQEYEHDGEDGWSRFPPLKPSSLPVPPITRGFAGG